MFRYYTGVGSRTTPPDVLLKIQLLAELLETKGLVLRSGGALGADSAFSSGVTNPSNKNIFIPWNGFNGLRDIPQSKRGWGKGNLNPTKREVHSGVTQVALDLAATVHSNWENLSKPSQCLHARNCYEVLGLDLNTPSEFLVCWTDKGARVGGTRTAIVLAERWSVPVYNLFTITVEEILEKI